MKYFDLDLISEDDDINFMSKDDLKIELALERSRSEDYHNLIIEIRETIQEIYSLCGEDEMIEKICSSLIDKTRIF